MIQFSVIIPLYNKESTIKETVQSVLNQTYRDFELIIVNDGSTDGSFELVNSIVDDRIKVINKANEGVSVARNTGVASASFDWIMFLDGDDVKDVEALENFALAIEEYQDKKIFSTGYTEKLPNENKRYWNKFLPSDGETAVIDYVDCMPTGEPPINSSNSAIHKSLFHEYGGFTPRQRQYEDHELWLRMYLPNSIVFINKSLVTVRRDLSGTASQNKVYPKDIVNYLNTFGNQLNKLNSPKKNQLQEFVNVFCKWFFYRKRKDYTSNELKQILEKMRNLLGWKDKLFLEIVFVLSKIRLI